MRATLVLVLFLALGAPARAGEEPLNKTCPVMTDEEVDEEIHLDYRGKRVWFCCESCLEDFREDPEKYLANLPQFADEGEAGAASEAGGEGGTSPGEEDRPNPRAEHPLGALHPVAVHLPVALTMAAALAALLGLLFSGRFLKDATTYSISLAALAGIPAFLLGEEAEEAMGRLSAGRRAAVDLHSTWGEATMYVLLGVAAAHLLLRLKPGWRPGRWVSLLLLLGAAAVVGVTGYLGGEVARPGHLDALLGR